jgi:K+-transporting ATPase ATPase A chain
MEGKEVRFGVHGSVLAAITTSNGATGSYDSMHDSYTALGGMVLLINMLLGEIIYGGLGTGLYSMVMVVLIGAFIGGLMVGRTPSYLGKQLTAREMKLVMLYSLAGSASVLFLTAIAVSTEAGRAGLTTNDGAHGFTEIVYAYASAFANNGQNFAGLSADSVFYNLTTSIAMLIGRFGLAALALALAGSLSEQVRRPPTAGTFATESPTFAVLLLVTIIILVSLSFLPILALGPLADHFIGAMRP